MPIVDSGARQEFETGAVRDIQKGKGRCDLMPLDVVSDAYMLQFGKDDQAYKVFGCLYQFVQTGDCLHLCNALSEFIEEAFDSWSDMFLEVSKHFEEGAEKYGEGNWQRGLPVKCYINSGVRHYLKWLRQDADENHHLAFCWNVICAWWTCKHKPELNDYGLKECPVCSEPLPREAKFCDNCQVSMMDPDDFMGEYEEEND